MKPVVAFFWRRGPLLFGLAVFVLVLIQTDSWWKAALASFAANPGLPILIGLFLGVRSARKPDPLKIFIDVPQIADDDQSRACVADVDAAREALLRSGTARIEWVRHLDIEETEPRRGLLDRAFGKVLDAMRDMTGEGVVDLAGSRSMVDYRQYAETQIEAVEYGGYSGGPLRPWTDRPRQPTPLALLNLLRYAVRAADSGADEIDGATCRRCVTLLDLSAVESSDLWIPEWPDQTAVPMTVWLDSSTLRRLCYQETALTSYSLTMADHGLDVSDLDWDRLSTFRTPRPNHDAEPNLI